MPDFEPHRPISFDKPSAPIDRAQLVPRPAPPHPVVTQHPGFAPPAPVPYPVATTTVVTQQSNAEIVVAWIFTALTLLYMLPWAIAASRRSTNSIVIAVATFFLAWTLVGWLVMLVLSFLGPTVYTARAVTTTYAPPPPVLPPGMWAHCPTDPPHVTRWWDGRAWTAHTTVH